MSDLNKDTNVVDVIPQTEVPGNSDDTTPPVPNQDPVDNIPSNEEVIKGIEELAKTNSLKPTRKQNTIEKETRNMESSIMDGEIDYSKLANIVTDTEIGRSALTKFAEQQGLTAEEVKNNLNENRQYVKLNEMTETMEFLKERELEREATKDTDDFVSYYKKSVGDYGLTPSEFSVQYGDSFDKLYQEYSVSMSKVKAAELAFKLTVGMEKRLDEAKADTIEKLETKQNAASPNPTPIVDVTTGKFKLMKTLEVNTMDKAERIAYKRQFKDANGYTQYAD